MIQLAAGAEEHSRCRGLGRRGALSPGSADTPPLATVRPGFSLEQWDPGMKSTSLENPSHLGGRVKSLSFSETVSHVLWAELCPLKTHMWKPEPRSETIFGDEALKIKQGHKGGVLIQ